MASTGLTEHTSTPPSQPNFKLIIDAALADYAHHTGINLPDHPFSEKLQISSSPGDILGLLEERVKGFEYREGSRILISCLSPVVRVIHAFSGILGEAVTLVSQVSFRCIFVLSQL